MGSIQKMKSCAEMSARAADCHPSISSGPPLSRSA